MPKKELMAEKSGIYVSLHRMAMNTGRILEEKFGKEHEYIENDMTIIQKVSSGHANPK